MPQIIPLPAFTDNYVWAIREGDRAAVVDPGDAVPVRDWLRREGVALAAILVTHHHRDHTGGIVDLLRDAPVPVIGPAREAIPGRTRAVAEGDRFDLPGIGLPLEVLDIPGHTAGHVAFFGRGAAWGGPIVFCGDTLFAGGCGRVFEGTPREMWASLCALAALPGDTRVCCGHEYTLANLRFASAVEPGHPEIVERAARESAKRARGLPTLPSTIAEERATNPFLRAREPRVRAIAEARSGHPLADDAAVFAALREWKNAT
ncbi:MAG TPA: hydroxyacylglutathione hydrolase [Casimicrobiaceae bacterium]|nr:hydroxyacylglutathione hydrolase [Casimicrobiaceae bacterium]